MAKRLFDITLATIGLIFAAPLLLILGALVRLDTPGPALYRSKRVGQAGVQFDMLKLRTMVVDADCVGSAVTHSQDPRVTRVGRLLRQYKLDELTQLINVLRGEMSIVGPRPESPCYVRQYTPEQRCVLQVRPGITGQAQIEYRNEELLLKDCADIEQEYVSNVLPRKLAIDLDYVQHRNMLMDLRIILQTVVCVLKRQDTPRARRLAHA